MDANGNGKRIVTKFRDLLNRQRQDSEGGPECPDLDFVYDDADNMINEIAELYSYTEQPEFQHNLKAFEDQMKEYKLAPFWQKLSEVQQRSVVMKLLDQLEVSNKSLRMKAARCILYLAQGCWAELQSDAEQQEWSLKNIMLLYECGVLSTFVELLNIEIENCTSAATDSRKLTVSLADSTDLRIILSVLYLMIEVMRVDQDDDCEQWKINREAFRGELGNPLGDELLVVKLLGMVTRFCSGSAPHFPMKKVLLVLWKTILVSLGGMDTLRQLKQQYREQAGLSATQDTMEVVRTMRASSPPASAADLLEAQNQKRNNRPFRRSLMKQSSLDEISGMEFESSYQADEEVRDFEERQAMEEAGEVPQPPSPRPSTPIPSKNKGLPWAPKARQKDLDMFLENTRVKFVGFPLQGDRESLAGLPHPIHEGVEVLKHNMYTSLAEIQIQKEEEIARNPLSTVEPPIPMTPTEVLYQGMLPNLPQYMIALLKILLAAAPTSKTKTDSINILADVLPEEMPMTVLQSMKLGMDVSRHKEIIVKAVSAVLLLLLKHFKINHIYQFEFMSQHLVFANCIPLVLKFFNQNIIAYVSARNSIPILDFPACVIGDQPELTIESLEIGENQQYSWRNIFSCINLLRILNKLTKWKHSRIMMLVVFKSAPILRRTLKVRHAMMQLYVLKLLKMQTKYLGRQWRKSNMKTMSAIYQKVRHRLNDDWAYGNDQDARPWDFQAEECALRSCVDRFNSRRYGSGSSDPEFEPMDHCVTSVLGQPFELTDYFKQHYEVWLQSEVFDRSFGDFF
ncbi:striatin-interacting protein 1 [Schistocerca americana]|uniref:striatin-interacting protein 1 n=1 Tax=Schistocerca americana TaxID=7009 RepID=UPI001F4FBFFB|nr:striatin-interacting protein 1 [Schistocerca americana]XP_049947007.1 striatin-interacting protein 1-like [Schistocerca serialis cubense]XP_049957427.1 striatin-interacting protein 1-like [Schistocerca serialis cubense]